MLKFVDEAGGDVEPTEDEDDAEEDIEEEALLFVELALLLFRLETVTSFCGEFP